MVLQAMARVRLGRKRIKNIIRLVYEKRVDPYTGNEYYYNTMTRKSKWTKPICLGSNDLAIDEWVMMVNAEGNPYFKQNVRPFTQLPEKPPGYRVCLECGFHLAKRRCLTCVNEFCLECWENKHTTWTKHKWERVHVRETYCVMCKTTLANEVCVHCNLDSFCKGCSRMMHGKPARSKHVRVPI